MLLAAESGDQIELNLWHTACQYNEIIWIQCIYKKNL